MATRSLNVSLDNSDELTNFASNLLNQLEENSLSTPEVFYSGVEQRLKAFFSG